MKLKEYLAYLNQLVKANPKVLDCDIFTASDPEGNEYHPVHYHPTPGRMVDGFFDSADCVEGKISPTTVCLN